MVAAALRARPVLLAASLAALLTLALTLAAPVAAQEETTNQEQTVAKDKNASDKQEQPVQGSGQRADDGTQAEEGRTADPLEAQTANINSDSIGPVAVAGCEAVVGETASITVSSESGGIQEVFTADENTAFQFGDQGITIAPEGDGADFLGDLNTATGEAGEVVRSEGVVCDDAGGQRVDDDEEVNPADDDTETADELASLSCDELLVLFRAESGSGRQYGDAAVFTDSDVRARVEVCLEEEIIKGTAADDDLPDTGGLSLLALAVLGVVSAVAGLSVIRGGQR